MGIMPEAMLPQSSEGRATASAPGARGGRGPAARSRAARVSGSAAGKRHSSARPPAEAKAAAQSRHQGAIRPRDGLHHQDPRPGPAGLEERDQQSCARRLVQLVGGEGRDHRAAATGQGDAIEVARARSAAQPERPQRAARFPGRPAAAVHAFVERSGATTPGPRPRPPPPSRTRGPRSGPARVRRRAGRAPPPARSGSAADPGTARRPRACPRRPGPRPRRCGPAAPRRGRTGPGGRGGSRRR